MTFSSVPMVSVLERCSTVCSGSSSRSLLYPQLSLLEDAVEELSKFQGEMRVKDASVSSLPIDIWESSSLSLLKGRYIRSVKNTVCDFEYGCHVFKVFVKGSFHGYGSVNQPGKSAKVLKLHA